MQTNNLTLVPVDSKLNNLTLYEPVDVKILDKLINSDLLKVTFNNPLCAGYENEKQYLCCYKKLIKQGKAVVKYVRAKGMNFGRVNPIKAQGLFSVRREIRHTLCKGRYVDIDIENCHPVLLLQICQKHDIECKYLSKYVNKREKYLAEVMEFYGASRDDAKKLFIRLMYFGTFDNWIKDVSNPTNTKELTFLKKFKLELNNIGNLIMNANPDLMQMVLDRKTDKNNIIGSVCSYFLQEFECRILEAVYLYCVEQKYIVDSVAVLCADGLMIEEQYFKPCLLDELVEVVDKQLGFKVKFTTKEFNQDYLAILNAQEPAAPIDNEGVFNDLEAAITVYQKYPHWVCCDGALYVFDDKTGLWTESEEVMFKIISRFDKFLYLMKINKDGEYVKTTKGYGNSTSLQRQMLPQIKTLNINNSWLTDTNLTSLNKILFINGFYDMSTGIFNATFDPNIVFFYRVQRQYSNKLDIEYIQDVKQRIFYNQLGDVIGDYLILNLARSLAGNRMKKIFFGLGETNAGKSTYVNATTNTFGDYIGTFNGENLCIKNSTADEAQLMRWAYLLRYKRIIFSNEIKNESVLSGNMMKKVSSGGDTLVGRTHGCEEKPFIPHFNTFCNANDLLEIKPFDSAINDRLNIISYSKKYVDNPSNEFELQKDDNLEVELKSIKFIEAFQFILFDSYLTFYKNGRKEYIPDAVKNCKTEWVGVESENTTINKFLESYEITNDVNHFTKSSDIEIWLKENKLNVSMTKFAIELKKYCSIKKFSNVETKKKKIAGKAINVWLGVKSIDDDEEEVNALDM